ncbi:MAG: rhodanese-like domain-containing protein [Gammaproteobacteria bacterium]|nr:rhodanese-like domain-containing protein [Gammaproteobacteria bacterium]
MGRFFEFVGNHPWLVTALVMTVVALLINESRRHLLGFKEVSPNEAVRLMNREEAVVLDVREDGEYKEGHIINARHIPVGVLESRCNELESLKEKPLIVYCRTGQRAAKASAILQRQGFKSVYKLNGGIMAWTGANMPVSKG